MTKPVLVALPGMLCTDRLWTQPGFGIGEDVVIEPMSLRGRTIAEMVTNVLALPYREMNLVGLSLGGIVALTVAAAAPERVSRLAVLSTTAGPPRPEQRMSWHRMAALTADGAFATITPELLLPMLISPSHQADPALSETILAMADDVGPKQFLDQLSAQRSRVDLRSALAAINCPVLVCAGQDDALAPLQAQREIATGVSNGAMYVVGEAGHLTPLEQPAELSKLLRYWLADEPSIHDEEV